MKEYVVIERLAGSEDLDGVIAVDRECFSRPWSRRMYEDDLLNPQSQIWLARRPERPVAGYCAMWLVLDEVHINNVAVLPAYRGLGTGRLLVERVLGAGAVAGARSATLEVRRANVAARRLYERLGFQIRGERARYYDDPLDDALILWAEIQPVGFDSGA